MTWSTSLPARRSAAPKMPVQSRVESVDPGSAHRGDAVHELGLADAAHRLRSIGAIERGALREYGLHDVVARLRDVVADLVAEIDLLLEAQERFCRRGAQVP